MTDHDHLEHLLRRVRPPTADVGPSRDLWPVMLARRSPRRTWTSFDLATAVGVAVALWLSPGWIWLLAYHL